MDIFTTGVLRRVVQELPPPAPFFLNRFFQEEQREETEEIHFDVANGKRRIAPFVAPIVAGKVVQSKGYTTKTFKPAYVKDKRVFTSNRPLKRVIGEKIGGELSPAQRQQILLANDLQDQMEMVTRRLELMAIEAMRTGKVVVVGDDYPEVEVDFGRHADLTKALTLGARWGETGVEPLTDVEAWGLLVAKHSGVAATDVVMDTKAWQLFSASEKVQALLDRFRGKSTLAETLPPQSGGIYMGSDGVRNYFVHSDWYEDATGATQQYLPDYTVIMSGPGLDGVRCYGAIQDEKAGFQALPYFAKSWLEEDPAVRYLLMQSAPLPVPYRINGSFCATVR